MLEHRNEHGWHPVHRGTAFCFDRIERHLCLKTLRRKHHRGAMCERAESTQNASKAMVERHRNTDAVVGRHALTHPGVIAVEQHVAMRQRSPLGKAGCARCKLDIDGVIAPHR